MPAGKVPVGCNSRLEERFTLSLDRVNVLTGANNAGKSTVIGALRSLAVALRSARARAPERVALDGDERPLAYRISENVLPISVENIATNYGDGAAKVTFRLSNSNELLLHFDHDHGCLLIPKSRERPTTSAAAFKSQFPIDIVVVPILGAVEHREAIVEEATVMAALSTSRAARHFRNYWYRSQADFDMFADLVAQTWPGMAIKRPELDISRRELTMFVSEDRIDRELFWVGFGFQIWCQLLTHVMRASAGSLLVIDEPEIYLHPDIQRKLLDSLKDVGCDLVLATHSTEILAEADPAEIVLIDKRRASAERVRDIEGVQKAIEILGSQQNITLTALARNRRVLFVEDDWDFSIIRRFARRLKFTELSAGLGVAPIPSGGFGSWKRISILAEGVEQALGTKLLIGAVYDRDYFCDEEVEDVVAKLRESLKLAHVHSFKELENYLLIPPALDRAIERAVADRAAQGHEARTLSETSAELLLELSEEVEADAQAQYISKASDYFKRGKRNVDGSTLTKIAIKRFREEWRTLPGRLRLAPGKELLRRLRERVAREAGISLTDARIIDAIRPDEIPQDLRTLLVNLDAFRSAPVK